MGLCEVSFRPPIVSSFFAWKGFLWMIPNSSAYSITGFMIFFTMSIVLRLSPSASIRLYNV